MVTLGKRAVYMLALIGLTVGVTSLFWDSTVSAGRGSAAMCCSEDAECYASLMCCAYAPECELGQCFEVCPA